MITPEQLAAISVEAGPHTASAVAHLNELVGELHKFLQVHREVDTIGHKLTPDPTRQ